MNLQKLSMEYLNNLYLKSQSDFSAGYNAELINQLSGISRIDSKNIQNYLNSKEFIELGQYKGDGNIYIKSNGIDFVEKLKEGKIFNVIKFIDVKYIYPGSTAVAQFLFYYEIINESGDSQFKRFMAKISDVLTMNWNFPMWSQNPDRDYPNLIKILLQYVKDKIIEKVKEQTLNDYEEILMLSTEYPPSPPYNPENLIETQFAEYEVVIGHKNISQEIRENKLAASIIETRDIVNAIFYLKHKAKLLLLKEERNLLDFFKTATTEEEFTHRIASLGEVARNLNTEILRKITGVTDTQKMSIELLKIYFNQNSIDGEFIVETLIKIGRVRQGYPVHSDVTGVISGLTYFKISYPIDEYEKAWLILLTEYLKVLKSLYKILSDLYINYHI